MQLNDNITERENSLKFLSVIIDRRVGARGQGECPPPPMGIYFLDRFLYQLNLNQKVTSRYYKK